MKASDYKKAFRKEFKTLRKPLFFENFICLDPDYPEVDHGMFVDVIKHVWDRIEAKGLVYTPKKYDCENRGFSVYTRVVETWMLLRGTELQAPICLLIGHVNFGLGKQAHAWNGFKTSEGVWLFDQGDLYSAKESKGAYFPRIGII